LPTDLEQVGGAVKRETNALAGLWEKYHGPLGVYLRQRFWSFSAVRDNWEDLLGDFTAKKILAPGWLKTWDPHSGRFRYFLGTSLINFVWDWWRRQPGYKDWEDRQKKEWRQHRYFVAFNRAEDLCAAIVVDGSGAVAADFQFAHSAEGWKRFDRTMQTFP